MEEQIEKQAIEEIAKILNEADRKKFNSHCDLPSSEEYATDLYNAGYHKQSEGEWIVQGLANPKCSACNRYNRCGDKSDFCPNCGAKMKREKQLKGLFVAYNPCSKCEGNNCSICELSMYREGLLKKDKWISVEERLPEENKKYWCAYTDLQGKNKVGIFEFCAVYNAAWDANSNNVGKFTIFDGDCFVPVRVCVTHWMSLPEAPKMKDGAE